MKRKKLINQLLELYSKDSVKSILIGRMRPSYSQMLKLYRKYRIPFTAWEDIKVWLKEQEEKETRR